MSDRTCSRLHPITQVPFNWVWYDSEYVSKLVNELVVNDVQMGYLP